MIRFGEQTFDMLNIPNRIPYRAMTLYKVNRSRIAPFLGVVLLRQSRYFNPNLNNTLIGCDT